MNRVKYFLQGFGFKDSMDFKTTVFKLLTGRDGVEWSVISMIGGFLTAVTGLKPFVFLAFVVLIFMEFYSGVRVARKIKSEKFKSRKMGRMFMKIGVYMFIITMLHAFSQQVEVPDIMGLNINPFVWLYHAVFLGITFQLIISYFENLGRLGYAETKSLAGFITRRLSRFFETDGTKNNEEEEIPPTP